MRRMAVLAAVWMACPAWAEAEGPVDVKFHDVKAIKQRRTVVPSWSNLARPIVCKLDFEVDASGHPVSVTPEECPQALHKNAIKAGMKWEFEPHIVDGQPVAMKFRMVLKITH